MTEDNPQIKVFSYINKNNQVEDIKLNYGQKWSDIKTDNEVINSVFAQVSKGKETVEAKDLNLLNRIFLFADNLLSKTGGNEILEVEELSLLKEKFDSGEININSIPEDSTPNINNWSEGTDRVVSEIQICEPEFDSETGEFSDDLGTIPEALQEIAEKEGFKIVRVGNDVMMEDSHIRRSDGKYYIQYNTNTENSNKNGADYRTEYLRKRYSVYFEEDGNSTYDDMITNERFNGQGRVADEGKSFNVNLPKSQLVYGTSYLEGGNVLNTLKKDGTPGAIIGEESIGYTLNVMGLDNTPDNVKLAKKQISEDLGLNEEDITYIPQYDYHIDMLYRPLHNGDIAIPDFEEGIRIIKDMPLEEGQTEEDKEESVNLVNEKATRTKKIRQEAEEMLKQAGYNIIRIPNIGQNYMNGVTGTSPITGKSFYITNSTDEKTDEIIKKYFENAGIDHVYFVPTFQNGFFAHDGAIDCMTQEK